MNELVKLLTQEKLLNEVSKLLGLCTSIVIIVILSYIIFFTYKKIYSSDNYNSKFCVLLIILIVITTMIINLIERSLMTSLGLLGLISIVRFRVKLKDFREIGFLLWAIAMGVAIGTENYVIGISYSIMISLLFLYFNRKIQRYYIGNILVIRSENISTRKLEDYFLKEGINYILTSEKKEVEYKEYIYHIYSEKKVKKLLEKLNKEFQFDYVKFI